MLDFDGTCTQIPEIWETYLELFFNALGDAGFNVSSAEWSEACDAVRKHSPKAAWTLAGCAAAPAAADPYMLADEATKLILRRRNDRRQAPTEINAKAYAASPAPWREEAPDTFAKLIDRGLRLHFVSNSSTVVIAGRLQELLANPSSLERQDFSAQRRGKISCLRTGVGRENDAAVIRSPEAIWGAAGLPGTTARSPIPSNVPSISGAEHILLRSAACSAAISLCSRKPCFAATSGKWIWQCHMRLEPRCICRSSRSIQDLHI